MKAGEIVSRAAIGMAAGILITLAYIRYRGFTENSLEELGFAAIVLLCVGAFWGVWNLRGQRRVSSR